MNKEQKQAVVAELTETFKNNDVVYLADTTGLSANATNAFRRALFNSGVSMRMAKNTLINIAMVNSGKDFGDLKNTLAGSTCVMVSEQMKAPAIAIKSFCDKGDLSILKGAWIDSSVFLGNGALKEIIKLKSKNELIGEIIGLLQSPARNVISALQGNAGQKIAGLVKAVADSKA
ncbi:MAG: 50S ribosomal protein L10 [Bacteroidetes bacterium]|nr:50S ribosomal protein L10 [Bacteroidota bacterium]